MSKAPVALFVYNRPHHTRQTLEALSLNHLAGESELFIFSDAPKTPETLPLVLEVREYLKTITGFKSVSIIERSVNYGLANSIIDGVTQICDQYGCVIVLEDDLVTSPHFLRYMNDALGFYALDERVISIHGYVYPVQEPLPETFFLRGADCWGWATWKRGWDLFDSDAKKLYDAVIASGEADIFDFHGQYRYTAMLKRQIEGRVNSWAIRWYASAFLSNKLTLYPGTSLVQNIGNDNSGTHSRHTTVFNGQLAQQIVPVSDIPVVASKPAYVAISRYFASLRPSLLQRVRNKAAWLLRKLIAQ